MKRNDIFYLIIIFILSIFIIYKIINYEEINLVNGKIYEFDIKVEKNIIMILKVNNKNVSNNIYLKNYDNFEYGKYKLIGKYEIKKIKIYKIKEYFSNKIIRNINKLVNNEYEKNTAAFINSVIFRNRENLNKNLINSLNYLGLTHILSISGMHIYIIVSFMKKIKFNTNIIMIVLIIYLTFIGISTSSNRALLMFIAHVFSKNLKLNVKKEYIFVIILLISIFDNIYIVFNKEFIFSYFSIFIILFIIPKIKTNFITFNLILQIFLIPFTYYYSKKLMLFSFLVNYLMLPYFSILINIIIISLCLNFFKIRILNGIINYSYLLFEKTIYNLSNIKYISIEYEKNNVFIYKFLLLIVFFLIYLIYNEKINRYFIEKN